MKNITTSILDFFNSDKKMEEYEDICKKIKAVAGVMERKYSTDDAIRIVSVILYGDKHYILKQMFAEFKKKEFLVLENIEYEKEMLLHSYITKWMLDNKDKCIEFKEYKKK